LGRWLFCRPGNGDACTADAATFASDIDIAIDTQTAAVPALQFGRRPRVGDFGPALLALEDGRVFPGVAFGSPRSGEATWS